MVDALALLQRVLSTPFECTYLRCCVWVIRDNQREGHFRHSWLPYSTYLYLDFHLFCSMTKLKEYSREICYPRRVPIFVRLFDKYEYIVRFWPKLDHQPFQFCQGIIWCVCFVHEIYLQCKQTWDLSKNLHDWKFQGKKFTQKTRNFRHLLNRDKKCVNALN